MLAFVPVLWPVVLVLGLLTAAFALYLARKKYPDEKWKELLGRIPLDRDLKTARRSIFAVGLNLLLYAIIAGHSYIFYIWPLKNDLNPVIEQDKSEYQQKQEASQ